MPTTMFDMRIDPLTGDWVFPNGRRLPRIAGGSTTVHDEVPARHRDTDVELEDDDEEEQTPEEDEDRDDDWTPPDKVEWERIKSALKNERRDRKKNQREFEDKIKNLTTSGTAAAMVEIEKARIEEREKVEKKWMRKAIRAEAASLFAAQGASAANSERLSRMVDESKVQYDDRDEEFDGLEDEVEEIIAENPEFFRKPKDDEDTKSTRTTSRPRVDAGTRGQRGGGTPKKRSTADRLAEQALGRTARRR